MEKSLKTGFAKIFSCYPKSLSCPKFGGAAAPLGPPARTPMFSSHIFFVFHSPNCPNSFLVFCEYYES